MSSKPRRLAVLAVATTLATAAGTAQAASAQSATPAAAAQPSAHWVVVPESAAVTPPASVSGLARDLGVDNDFARRVLDELTSSR
jgi:pyruvate/2-oxoglutarate dehydrogenase complex dihydrolipoamide acyltransferase (E2) component